MQKETENSIHIMADSFQLLIHFSTGVLHVKLWSLVEELIYEKSYSDKDVGGGEINKKLELPELFETLMDIFGPKGSTFLIEKYAFGEVYAKDGIPYLKIMEGGLLFLYAMLGKKQLASELRLLKVCKIAELEKNILVKMTKNDEKQSNNLLFFTMVLEEQKELRKRLDQMKTEMQKMETKIDKIVDILTEIKPILKNRCDSDIQMQIIKQVPMMGQKISENPKTIESSKLKNLAFLTAITQSNISHFRMIGKTIEYISSSSETQLLFNRPVLLSEQYTFKIRLSRIIATMYFAVGFADYEKVKGLRQSYTSKNAVACYLSNTKTDLYNSAGKQQLEGMFFKMGDIVEVIVKRSEGKMEVLLDGQKKHEILDQILKDCSRVFLPMISMYNQNDIVELLEI